MRKRDFEQKLAKEAKVVLLDFEIPHINHLFLLAIPNYPRLTDPAFVGSAAFADYGAPKLFKRCNS